MIAWIVVALLSVFSADAGAPSTDVQIVMEPTGMAWFPVAVYYARQAVPIYLVNSQEVADLFILF